MTTVFYIDDDQDDMDLVQWILADLNQASIVFHNSKDLMLLLENPPPEPSIIIIDLNMPQHDGIEVLSQIRVLKKFDNIPLVMYSTTASPLKVEQCRRLGANLFMVKGRSLDNMVKSFTQLLSVNWKTFKPNDEEFVIDFNKR